MGEFEEWDVANSWAGGHRPPSMSWPHCYGPKVSSQNPHVEALTPNVAVFGDEASKEVIKVK